MLPVDYFESLRMATSIQPISPNDNAGSWKHNDWRIGLDYDKNENTLLYAVPRHGLQSGWHRRRVSPR